MGISIADQYLLKAFDCYPYDLDSVAENLNYALSYDEVHVPTLVLLGRMYMEQLKNFSEAKHYFEVALSIDPVYVETYEHYSLLSLWTGSYAKVLSLYDRSVKVKGINIAVMRHRRVKAYEQMGLHHLAAKEISQLVKISGCQEMLTFHESEKERINKLIELRKQKLEA
jgi:tetratricopeptide (TPR) repeat protein